VVRLVDPHHITMSTGDAQRCVDFHADVLGLGLIKTIELERTLTPLGNPRARRRRV
jgi:catechol 2,3-dioxygenase-like lactoylglutathione lyase family enzyme